MSNRRVCDRCGATFPVESANDLLPANWLHAELSERPYIENQPVAGPSGQRDAQKGE